MLATDWPHDLPERIRGSSQVTEHYLCTQLGYAVQHVRPI